MTRGTLSRRAVAEFLGIHQDSVTRRLPDGLGAAVVRWGGNSRPMAFSEPLVRRWHAASLCRRRAGRPCAQCHAVLEDCGAVAEHLIETRHGWRGCVECTPAGELCQPCQQFQ